MKAAYVRPGKASGPLAALAKSNLAICFVLAAATFALYSSAIRHSFIPEYDDNCYVTGNAHVQAGLVWKTVTWALTAKKCGNWHPLSWFSHALDYQLYGLNPHGHHLTNVFIHVLNVLLLYLLLVWATGAVGRSVLVAGLFAVHPFNVESVAWVAERKNVLSTLFFLLALGAYGWYARRPTVKRYLVVATLFVLGLASKPMVITLPCVLLLLDFWPLRRIQGGEPSPEHRHARGNPTAAFPVPQVRPSQLVLEKLPLLALSVASAVITVIAQRSHGFVHWDMPRNVRLENAVYAYAMYVGKAFWPMHLAVFYPHPWATLAVWQVGPAALFLLAVSALVWRERGKRPYLIAGWLWFLGTLVPVIGLLQVGEQAMADRYTYVPLIGIFWMVVWGAADWADSRHVGVRLRVPAVALVLLVLAFLTRAQIGYWRSNNDLFSHTLDVTSDNYVGEEFLGTALLTEGRSAEALPHLQNAVRIRPLNPVAHLRMASVLAMVGRSQDAILEDEAAIPRLSDPNLLTGAYESLGKLYSEAGNYAKARASYEEALRIAPQELVARNALAMVEFSDAFQKAAAAPSGANYLRLGQLYQQAGRIPEARAAYTQALHMDPRLAEAAKDLRGLNGLANDHR